MKNKGFKIITCALGLTLLIPFIAEAKTIESYTIEEGDSLWKIAEKYYGNGNAYTRIAGDNKSVINNPNLIYPGQKLQITVEDRVDNSNHDKYVVRGDDYQMGQLYIGTTYDIETFYHGDIVDHIITINDDIAEVTDTTITPKSIGAGFVWLIDKDGNAFTNFSIAVMEPDAYVVWCDENISIDSSYGEIESVSTSDETIATAKIEKNEVLVHGKKVGSCICTFNYKNGKKQTHKINVIDNWNSAYNKYGSEVDKILKER